MPNLAVGNGVIHPLEEFFGMMARIEDAVILAQQLVSGVFADAAELLIDIGDRALDVGDSHDSVLIECKLLISEFFERSFAGGKAFFHRIFSPLTFGDVSP